MSSRLTFVKFLYEARGLYDLYKCTCGSLKTVRRDKANHEYTKSCGCLSSELKSKRFTKHGEAGRTTEYRSWGAMKQRCYNRWHKAYKNYGGRGIKICKRWLNSYKNFLKDMGRKPNRNYTLDRINNNGNYRPSNCRWATWKQQQNNKRPKGSGYLNG